MTERVTTLAQLDRARTALAAASDFWDIREIHNVAEAGRAYALVSGLGQEAINYATTIKLEAARKGGQALARMQKQHGGKPRLGCAESEPNPPTLADLGVTERQSSDWQALGRLDDATFTATVEEAKAQGTVSETAVVKKARSRKAKAAYAERQAAPKPPPPPAPPGILLAVADARALPLPANVIDLIVTSPPYALDIAYEGGDVRAPDWVSFMADWLLEALRVTKPNGRLALNVPLDTSKPSHRPTYAQAVWAALSVGWLYKATIVWDEGNTTKGGQSLGSVNSAARPHYVSPAEVVAVFYKRDWAPSSDGPDDIAPEEWQDWGKTIWRFSGESRGWEGHPAAFPFELPRRLLRYFSRVGDSILDPFVGSGTTMLAARRLGRRGFGFDLSAEYITAGRRRLAAS